MTREQDVVAAVAAGADAIGFVCYPKSPRYVPPARLRLLAREVGVFATPVLLFVNASADLVEGALESVPEALLQFHGDEHEPACHRYGRPYLRAIRVGPDLDWARSEREYHSAAALLADAAAPGYGGGGQRFDWSLVPASRDKPLVLAGGLDAGSVADAIRTIRPYAVDVSSGIEEAPGVKSARRIEQFVAAVRAADDALARDEVAFH